MSRMHKEDGFTIVEVLIVSVLMLIVLGATLTTFESFQQSVSTNQKQNEAQDTARNAIDLMLRDLRNLASPTTDEPLALDLNEAQQIIFQSEGRLKPLDSFNAANTTRVRYCLSTSGTSTARFRPGRRSAFRASPTAPHALGPRGRTTERSSLRRTS